MKMYEVGEVIEVQGEASANEKLREGWKLIAIVAGNDARPWYVFGRKTN